MYYIAIYERHCSGARNQNVLWEGGERPRRALLKA
jgi:hypothetical protein